MFFLKKQQILFLLIFQKFRVTSMIFKILITFCPLIKIITFEVWWLKKSNFSIKFLNKLRWISNYCKAALISFSSYDLKYWILFSQNCKQQQIPHSIRQNWLFLAINFNLIIFHFPKTWKIRRIKKVSMQQLISCSSEKILFLTWKFYLG
jgi:hypothetical protein